MECKVRRRRTGKLKELPGTLIKICTGTGFNKERAIAQVEGGSSLLVSCNN